jgi:alpha-methylacyl-CoA racemase
MEEESRMEPTDRQRGPLGDLTVLEIGGAGPNPYAGMVLADLGARVTRVEPPVRRTLIERDPDTDFISRGKQVLTLDLKSDEGRDRVLELVDTADVLTEGFRPGVMERLGLGPGACASRNPGLVYARVTGWGQDGPLAQSAGHDINYIALTGALDAIGVSERSVVPLNLIGDYAGGSLFQVVGILAAVHQRRATGAGCVVDVAMVDGVNHLLANTHTLRAMGRWAGGREDNLLDGGAPFYAVYRTADGRQVAVGAIEPQFFAALVSTLGIDFDRDRQYDESAWPELRQALARTFAARSREEWEKEFCGVDACVSPVLGLDEVADHPHMRAREAFVAGSRFEPSRAPRFTVAAGAGR